MIALRRQNEARIVTVAVFLIADILRLGIGTCACAAYCLFLPVHPPAAPDVTALATCSIWSFVCANPRSAAINRVSTSSLGAVAAIPLAYTVMSCCDSCNSALATDNC